MAIARQEREQQNAPKYEILHESSGDYLIEFPEAGENGVQKHINKTKTNELLYEEGLWSFLRGEEDEILILSQSPYVAICPTSEEDIYTLWVDGSVEPIMTSASRSVEVLTALKEALDGDCSSLRDEYYRVIDNYVDKQNINKLLGYFPDVEAVEHGWEIESKFLVTWNRKVFRSEDDMKSGTHVLDSYGAKPSYVSESREAIELEFEDDYKSWVEDQGVIRVDEMDATFDGSEMEFLGKVVWLLNRKKYFNDDVFWSEFE